MAATSRPVPKPSEESTLRIGDLSEKAKKLIAQRLKGCDLPVVKAIRREGVCIPKPGRCTYPLKNDTERKAAAWLVKSMEEDGILEEITPNSYKYFRNTHFNPLFLVPKPGNVTEEPLTKENVADRYRMVVDSRKANVATAPLGGDWKQYLSSVDDVLRSIPWSKDGRVTNREKPSRFFATVGVKAAYWRMHYDEDSSPLLGAAVQLPDDRTGEIKTRYFLHKALIMGWVRSAA
ncbi:hypothetical protein Pmar_PMAR011124 [Perkinsus marinus ATCC 50983]|uniref:Uncharacterized protein n=1 Tax=Perkinsus marinus (strain ATCC 50983 / TXsc) TaxID=423536 RepID=C5KVS3_PERM5|nr:hypothetical protein Pmar_PMAR011124 [Perkinsus marinus ATCC 50983]EER11458.1 hypothetical protein Pmar_PMAR011124 [Perkinsus marinus ATCC 50983]|eukprot:XP_002779663.1 hypothetical protein Pmar_PMAR011124 [Perkinsus marinus ATCC 50983]